MLGGCVIMVGTVCFGMFGDTKWKVRGVMYDECRDDGIVRKAFHERPRQLIILPHILAVSLERLGNSVSPSLVDEKPREN